MTAAWRTTSLGDVADLLTGFPFKSSGYTDDLAGIRLVRGDNIVQGSLRWDGVKRWPVSSLNGLSSYELADDDVVLAMDRPWIEAGLKFAALTKHDLPALLVQRVARLRGGPQLDTGFLKYLIGSRAFTEHVLAVQTGTAVPHISASQVKSFLFECPPLATQRRIADVLGTLDGKIELNRRMNETLEAMARALFKSWFIDFDPVCAKAAGRKPFGLDVATAALFPTRFVDSLHGKVPMGWQAVPLPEAIEVNPERRLSRGTVAPYLEMSNMPTTSARAVAWVDREFNSGMRFINGDVLLARITPCLENGKTAYVDFLADGQVGWGSTEYIVLRSKPPLPTAFAYFLARTDEFRNHAVQNMTGTSGRQRAPAECLDKYRVVVPPEPIAARFGELVAPTLAALKSNDEQSASLAAAREALLPKLLSGDVRPGIPVDTSKEK